MGEPKGRIILINGPSSSGKSTLAAMVYKKLEVPFIRFSFDLFLDGYSLPKEKIRTGQFDWKKWRPGFVKGYHSCWAAFAEAGNNLLIDHIIEEEAWITDLLELLNGIDLFCVGVHCSTEELERREQERGNRRLGDALRDLDFVHKYIMYNVEINTEQPLEENANTLIQAWKDRNQPSAFEKMRQNKQ